MKRVKQYKLSRRFQTPLFEKTQTQKFVLSEQRKAARQPRRMSMRTDYGRQLLEKQKLRYLYGISETVLKNYVKKSISMKGTPSNQILGELLERRLDNVVYRLGLAPTRRMARQLVSHGHFLVNGRKLKIPSYQVKDTDEVSVREGSKNTKLFRELLSSGAVRPKVSWVAWNKGKQVGTLQSQPMVDDSIFSISTVLEYYSR